MKLIAETAWHHEGDFNFLWNLALEIKKSKADLAKFHLTLDLDEYIDNSHSLYENYHKWKISESDWQKVLEVFDSSELMLLCNDTKSIEFAMKFNPSIIEIHAVCMNDLHMLDCLKKNVSSNTKIALGISGNNLDEIDFAINYLNHPNIILMYGFQNYPTKFVNINFNKLKRIIQLYPNAEFGYADHCGFDEEFNELITLTGASLGVAFIEKHVTTDIGVPRLDYEATISFDMLNQLHDKMQIIFQSFGNGNFQFNEGEENYARLGTLKKVPILKRDIKKGDILLKNNLEFKRAKTTYNYSTYSILKHIGKKINKNIKAGSFITPLDLGKE